MVNSSLRTVGYGSVMNKEPAHIILNIETKQPIEIADFVSAFTSLAGQYERYMRLHHPEYKGESKMYVREVRKGSIEADIIPLAVAGLIEFMDQTIIVKQFVEMYAAKISTYFRRGGRVEGVSKGELKEFIGGVKAVARDPKGRVRIKSASFVDGEKQIATVFEFDTQNARIAEEELEDHKLEIEQKQHAPHERVLMVFARCDKGSAKLGKSTGERAIIEEISPKDFPLIYASEMAETRIKHEVREAEENVFKKGFVVDAFVQQNNGRPVAYRITNVHQVIDLPED